MGFAQHNMPKVVEMVMKITLVDPPTNRVEGAIKDGTLITIIPTQVGGFFVWPQVGEFWTIRRENYNWILNSRVQNPNDTTPTISSLPAGTGYLHASSVLLSDNSTLISSNGIKIIEGANAKQGVATLVAGIITVANTSITASSRIQVTSQTDGGTPGFLRILARVVGVSFTIKSSSTTDTSVVAYQISEPAT